MYTWMEDVEVCRKHSVVNYPSLTWPDGDTVLQWFHDSMTPNWSYDQGFHQHVRYGPSWIC